ncbi:MAG: hypothetical protein K2M55_09560 [Muribaculaceae bacterium]|nr:hypothetical protein [Muribaculaceae bacterium]
MKKFYLGMLACMMMAGNVEAKTIYGYQAWENVYFSEPTRGPLTFDSENPAQATLLKDCSDMGVFYGGYYFNYHWYGQAIVKGTQSTVDGMYEIDMVTGERTRISNGGTKLIDMTYDYSTGKVYGIRNGNRILAEYDPATGENTALAIVNYNGAEVYLLAMAAAYDGTLYGISADDNLYKIALDGALTLVGNTGVDAGFDQTMAFDYNDGTLYWVNNGDYNLYTVDLATGKATSKGAIGANGCSSMASLFVPFINVAKGAPDRVTDIKAQSTSDAVTLSWTNPSITAQGEKLGALTGINVYRNGTKVATLTTGVAAGATMSYIDSKLAEGEYSYSIEPYNAAGAGGVDTYQTVARVGKDLPAAVRDLKATPGDRSAILTWLAPDKGLNGGVFDPADITGYRILRNGAAVGTTQETTFENVATYGTYKYSVVPLTAAGEGATATIEGVIVKPADWIVMQQGTATVEAGKDYKFYDEGGNSANYANTRNDVLTITPETGSYLVAEFTAFSFDTYGDYLEVYNGNSMEAPLVGKFAATSVPVELKYLESSAADGSLTFRFYSDIMETAAGWEATVKAVKRQACDLELAAFTAPGVVVAGQEARYGFKIVNKGLAKVDNYKLRLCSGTDVLAEAAGPAIESGATAEYTLLYIPAAEGALHLTAELVCEADSDSSNNSASATQTVLPAGTVFVDLAAEPAESLVIAPASFMGIESLCEILLPADVVAAGKGMTLSSVSFPYDAVTSSYNAVPFVVYAGVSAAADLITSIPVSKLTKVYEGSIDVVAGSEALEFVFDEPFEYTDGSLVLMVHKKESKTNDYGVSFRGSYGLSGQHDNCIRFDSRWDAEYDALNPEAEIGWGANNHRPDMKLVFSSKSGVTDVAVDAADLFSHIDGGIVCHAAATVYNTSGAVVATVAAGEALHLTPGIYVVAAEGLAVKTLVK